MLHSAGTSFFGPAPDGLVPQLVPRDELQRANALLEVTRNVPAIFGPVVAGVLIALFGTGWVFMLDAVSFAVSALRLSLVRLPPKEPREREPFLRAARHARDPDGKMGAALFGIRTALLVSAALIAVPSVLICLVPAVRRVEREPYAPAPLSPPRPSPLPFSCSAGGSRGRGRRARLP